MREPYIYDGDENIDGELLYQGGILEYKGVRFTGTLIYSDTQPVSYSQFENGEYDGKEMHYYGNGQLAEMSLHKNGECIEHQEWYSNGKVKQKMLPNHSSMKWNKEGILVYNGGNWFYTNGISKFKYLKNGEQILDPNGKIAVHKIGDKNPKKHTYYQNILVENYFEILINPYPELDCAANQMLNDNLKHTIFDWINELYKLGDRKLAEDLLIGLFSHPEKYVSRFAKRLHSFIVMKKNGSKEKTYWLEGEPNSEFHKIIY